MRCRIGTSAAQRVRFRREGASRRTVARPVDNAVESSSYEGAAQWSRRSRKSSSPSSMRTTASSGERRGQRCMRITCSTGPCTSSFSTRDGELFLQKRSRLKDRHPNVWDSSAAGHVDAGEEYDEAAVAGAGGGARGCGGAGEDREAAGVGEHRPRVHLALPRASMTDRSGWRGARSISGEFFPPELVTRVAEGAAGRIRARLCRMLERVPCAAVSVGKLLASAWPSATREADSFRQDIADGRVSACAPCSFSLQSAFAP